MASPSDQSRPASGTAPSLRHTVKVIIVSSVMFTFISYWRTAAVVLCDLASTAFYIGGIVEGVIGPAAPWFILAVMVFSYFVRMVYLESCSLFVRGGVYRVVKEAMGGFLAKLSVSALMFDYILTGPISGVSAGQYIVRLLLATLNLFFSGPEGLVIDLSRPEVKDNINLAAAFIACGITLYFFYQNLIGIHESSEKAMQIMIATTIMGAIIIVWCLVTLLVNQTCNAVPIQPQLKADAFETFGFLRDTWLAQSLETLSGWRWFSLLGFIGFFIAFGHSILAMSGEETLAQVYREVEAPKMVNFKKAAFVVFVYSLLLTGGISFLAVLIIPDNLRMEVYKDNLIGGLAMSVVGPEWVRLLLNAFVVVVGFLILAGAVNTSIIGSNGVLNRVAEDGVMPDWFLKPHHRYGTTYRMLYLVTGLQLFTILVSRGNVDLLGEAYAFGVVWSFVFKALSMVVLRFRDPGHREYKVGINLHIGGREVPIGLMLIFLVLAFSALINLLTKEVATISGLAFTAGFLTIFMVSEHINRQRLHEKGGAAHQHMEQFNQAMAPEVTAEALGLTKPYRKLVAIRSPQNLFMLETALAETDPETTDLIVMTAKVVPPDSTVLVEQDLDTYDQRLMTAVVEKAEKAGKKVIPLIIPTNNPLSAVLRTAMNLKVNELLMGASNKFSADEQLEQITFYWITLHDGRHRPLTVRILSRNRDVYSDIEGGNRIPKITERHARTVDELRAAGVGVDRVLLAHDGTLSSSDLFQSVLTMLDAKVALGLVTVPPMDEALGGLSPGRRDGQPPSLSTLEKDRQRAEHLEREVKVHEVAANWGPEIVRIAQEEHYDLIIVALPSVRPIRTAWVWSKWIEYILDHAHCQVFLAARPLIPEQIDET